MADVINVPQKLLDKQIQKRLSSIAKVTEKYPELTIDVQEGIVIFKGISPGEEDISWLEKVSLKTQGVVAVIDKSERKHEEIISIDSTSKEIATMKSEISDLMPYLGSSLIIIALTILLGFIVSWLGRRFFFQNIENVFARKTLSRLVAIPLVALGLYLAFKVSGLTNLAATVIGGTGLIGLAIGFAMKGFFENFFSSMILSLRRQFNKGDYIEIEGNAGIIQSISSQGTTLMDYDGNNIFIPNAKFMNNIFKNYTLNPNMRVSFVLGIGYDDNITKAQTVILETLSSLKGVILEDPQPNILVKELSSATINIQVFFWINFQKISDAKALSIAQKMVKKSLMDAGVSMPDDAREVVFANALEVVRTSDKGVVGSNTKENVYAQQIEEDIETGFANDMTDISKQAQNLEEKLQEEKQS